MSAPQKAPPPLGVGDIAPRFAMPPATGGKPFDSFGDTLAGKPHVYAFAPTSAEEPAAGLLAARAEIERLGGVAVAIVRNATLGDGDGVLVDGEGALTAHYAHGAKGVVVTNRNGHVATLATGDLPGHVGDAVKFMRGFAAAVMPRPAERQAPVLFVPDVFSRADCERLIHIFETQGQHFVEPGHGPQNQKTDYKMRIPEYGRKDRIDHWIVNQDTMGLINDRLRRRLFPEIQKAFHYPITKYERYRIGCYEGERGGELHGHRDNTEPKVAHRRFACSINLNAEEFEGGELAFPEFGDQRFSPRTGEAAVFSSSILHEPLHVTKGRRLALLAFLFGDS